jgi:hypothetical protein
LLAGTWKKGPFGRERPLVEPLKECTFLAERIVVRKSRLRNSPP